MEYTRTVTVTETITIDQFPAYFKYGVLFRAKVLNDKCVIVAHVMNDNECAIEMRRRLSSNDWEPCSEEEFCEVAAQAFDMINAGCDIVRLELEGGPYAD